MKAEDYLELPEKLIHTLALSFSDKEKKDYETFEKESVLEFLEKDIKLYALNAVGLMNKLLQYSNGSVYDEYHEAHIVNTVKMEALQEIIEANEGKQILVFYSFQFDLDQIVKKFGAIQMKGKKQIDDWNANKIPLMIAHPKSAGHGLNLQAGGEIIVFFGLPWSLELYLQSIARLIRQGRVKPVTIYRLLIKGTVDIDVARALEQKKKGNDSLLFAVKAIVNKYENRY